MALQTSGPISLADIAAEFGGSTPHGMDEYRGSGGTPSTGAISFADFYGKSAMTLSLPSTVSGFGSTQGQFVYTNYATVTLSGGASPYTYLWEITAGPGTLANSSSSTTNRVKYPAGSGIGGVTGTLKLTITDNNGTSVSDTCTYDIDWSTGGMGDL